MISFVVALKNRSENFQQMVGTLAGLKTELPWELIVADFMSDDLDVAAFCADKPFVRLRHLVGDFNRSVALNRGAAMAAGSTIVFLDADIVVPAGFADLVATTVAPGVCMFPVPYFLHRHAPRAVAGDSRFRGQANGWWEHKAHGICAFTRDDLERIGPWNEDFGRSYGGEDNEFHDRAGQSLTIIREPTGDLFHLWHPSTLEEKGRYHEQPIRSASHYREMKTEKARKMAQRRERDQTVVKDQ